MIDEKYIEDAIEKTLMGESRLTKEMFQVRGFSPKYLRMLINNLTNFDCTYLESGLLCGATFVSSFNKDCVSIGLEDFSQDFRVDFPGYDKDELEHNVHKFIDKAKEATVIYESFLDIDKNILPKNIDIFFADFEHGLECQSVALPEIFDNMAEKFAYVVDDAEWSTVKDGTGVGFKFLRNKMWVEKKWSLRNKNKKDTTWGTGVDIYLIKKK